MPPQHVDLLSELEAHNAYFDSVVNMIPARLYVAGASGDDAFHPKYKAGQHKESKEARRARNKIAKREKFDPEKMETTLETKKRMKKEEEEGSDDDEEDGRDGDIVMSDGDGEDENDSADRPVTDTKESSSANGDNGEYASRIEMLRAKLRAKMAEKRAAAGIVPDSAADNSKGAIDASVSKRAARRAEKRKRQEAAKQRNKKKASSVAEHKKGEGRRVVDLGGSTYNAPTEKSSASATTAAQDLATIDYQSLAGLKPKLAGALDNKSLGGKKKKSLEHLLADAERKQARLKELKESGAAEDKEKATNIQWGEALKVAG